MPPFNTSLASALLTAIRTARDHLSPEHCRVIKLTLQTIVWATFVKAHAENKRLAICSKACESLLFSITHHAKSFAVPSKLVGVSDYQEALYSLHRQEASFGLHLDLEMQGGRLAAFHEGAMLGYVQDKHDWLKLLLPYGVRLYLIRVTGTQDEQHTLGINVAFGAVVGAICRHEAMRGTTV